MRKFDTRHWATVVLIMAFIGVAGLLYALWVILPTEDPMPRGVNVPKVPYRACYHEAVGVTVDTAYLLVDLSDSTNWPHSATNEIILKTIAAQGAVSGAHQWDLTVGVVVENDATDGTAVWMVDEHLLSLTGSYGYDAHNFPAGGLNLRVTSDALTYGVANNHSELTAWQNDTAISATVGTTGTVAVGDLVILADEITDGSTLDFSICVDYDTE